MASAPAAIPALERRQLDLIEPLARLLDDRQAEMGVDIGVAVARESV